MKHLFDNMEKPELVNLLINALTDSAYGILTRQGMEFFLKNTNSGYYIFCDIDGMHDLNALHGSYEPVNAMIKASCAVLRQDEVLIGRWFSGDELLVHVDTLESAIIVANRWRNEMIHNGLSGTFGVAGSVREASALVVAAKNNNNRGGINIA
jgi:hypothetical protein